MLLHRTTREALGIKLEGNIVIIDEAHNLIDTVTEIHSTTISLGQIARCKDSLSRYLTKYQARLKGKNVVYIRQLLFILDSLIKALAPHQQGSPSKDLAAAKVPLGAKAPQQQQQQQMIFGVDDFLIHFKIDNINFHKILGYLQTSELSKKLRGFVDKYESGSAAEGGGTVVIHSQEPGAQLKNTSPLFLVEPFLLHLATNEKNGRVLILAEKGSVIYSFLFF